MTPTCTARLPTPTDAGPSPREMWKVLETLHATIYFAREAVDRFRQLGLKGYWMGYVASRIAPLGPVSAEVATACFFGFHPRMLHRALPDAWSYITPQDVSAARLAAADAALLRLLGKSILRAPEMEEAASLARRAAEACTYEGRPLAAAYAALEWPTSPHLVLWQAATLLREHRGDGHSAALLAAGLDGCEANLTLVATGVTPRDSLQPHRGWSDDEWEAARHRLQQRGWLDRAGGLTPLGAEARTEIERRTDFLAAVPWQRLGPVDTARLRQLAGRWSERIARRGGIPFPNPMGLAP